MKSWDCDEIRKRVCDRVFPQGLVENRWRGEIVEEFVSIALKEDGWVLWSHDWSSWDLHHPLTRLKMQVKQFAVRQTWADSVESRSTFGIAPNKGYYVGNEWHPFSVPTRMSEIYVFAKNSTCGDVASHWDAAQWSFSVVRTVELADRKTIRIPDAWALGRHATISDLAEVVRDAASVTDPNGIWPLS